MRYADGTFTGALWGLRIDSEVWLTENFRIVPFCHLSESRFKKLITDRAAKLWNNAVWISQRNFDVPGAVIVRKVSNFPYIRPDNASFEAMASLETEAPIRAVPIFPESTFRRHHQPGLGQSALIAPSRLTARPRSTNSSNTALAIGE
jgi:hypothetical protein